MGLERGESLKLKLLAASAALALSACATQTSPAAPVGAHASAAEDAAPAPAEKSEVLRALEGLNLDIPHTRYVLKNGLTLIVHEDRKTPTVNVQVWYHVGSKNEPEGRSGFAHLFEHLMFNGSENFNDDFFKATQQIGASNQNGTTNTDRTNYYQTVPKEALDTVLWLESDRMGYLLGAVDQARLDEQRSVVQNEKRQGENQPYGQVNNRIVAATYPKEHPYGHTVIGSMEDLNAATIADVRDWFRTWYGPTNAVLVLAGDIKPEEAKAKVEKYFGEIPPGPPVSHPKAWTPVLAEDQREEMQDRVPQPRIYRTWNVPQFGHPDGERLDVIAYALAGDRNARLTKRLEHDEQIATSVAAVNFQSEVSGQFRIIVTAKPDADLAYIEKVVDEELARLLQDGPTAAELEKAKVQTLRGVVDSLELAPAKANLLAFSETIAGDPNAWKTSNARLMEATPAAAVEAGRRWLTKGSYTLVVKPFEQFAASGVKADRSAPPKAGAVADASFPDYQETKLSNGMRVLLVERRDVPRIDVQMLVDTGVGANFASVKPGVADLAIRMLPESAKSLDALAISDRLRRLGAEIGAGGGEESATVSLSALTATIDPVMEIYADIVRNPAFSEADFVRTRALYVQGLRQGLAQPNAIAGRVMARKLWGDDHPYGRTPTPDQAMSITREDVAAFHAQWFGPNNATLIVVGDTTLADMTPRLEKAFAGWRAAPGQSVDVVLPKRPAAPKVYLVDRPGSLQSVITAGAVLPPLDAKLNFSERLFNDIIGGDFTSRINMNLREDKGWSYGSRTGISSGEGPRQFTVTAPVQTDATQGALSELRKELTGIVGRQPPTAAELQKVQTDAVLQLGSRWETGAAVEGSLAGIVTYDFPKDYFQTYAASLRAVTLDDIRKTAKSFLPDQNLVWVIVGDLAKIEKGVRDLKLGEVEILTPLGDPAP